MKKIGIKGISVNQFNAIKQTHIHNIFYINDICQITAPLKKMGISNFSYVKFLSNTRMLDLTNVPEFIDSYLKEMDNFPQDSFFENTIELLTDKICAYPPKGSNIENNKIIQMEIAYGIGYGITFIKNDKALKDIIKQRDALVVKIGQIQIESTYRDLTLRVDPIIEPERNGGILKQIIVFTQ